MSRSVYLLDLRDEQCAPEYEAWHRPGCVPAGVLADIRAAGITDMRIYRFGERLVMVTEGDKDFDSGDRTASAASRLWEARMDHYQRLVPRASAAAKWQAATEIFNLLDHQS